MREIMESIAAQSRVRLILRLCRLLVIWGGSALAVAAPRVRVGLENSAPPLAYLDAQGQPAGFSAELLREMARTGQVEIELVPGFWRDNVVRFRNGEVDALANVIRTEANQEEFDLSIAHAWVHGVVYRRADLPPIEHTRDFAGKIIGTVRGTAANSDALRRTEWNTTIRTYETAQAAFDAAHRGECAAVLFSNRVAFPGVEDRGLKREFVDDLLYHYHIGVKVGDREKLAALNQALATVIANNTFARIYSKWIGPIEPRPIRLADLRPYAFPVLLGLVLITGLVGWQRHMLRRLARQAEALRLSEERWKFALEGSGAAVWDWDIAGGRVLYSQHWHELLGVTGAEMGERPEDHDERVHPEDRPKVVAARAAHWRDPAAPFEVEFRMRCSNGAWKWVAERGQVVNRSPDGQPRRMIGTCTDLTARKQAEADRLVLGKLESTGILAGGIAHDFNNLLTAITLNLDMLQLEAPTGEPSARYLRDIRKSARAAAALTQQLITFAEGGASVRQPVALGKLVREAAQMALSGSSLACEFIAADNLWLADGDAPQLSQVFRNLVLNARDAMAGSGTVVVRVANVVLAVGEVRALPAGDYVRVSVVDQGPGIPADMLPVIFDPYFSTKQRGAQRGMGLGLTICHSVVAKHDGAITVESTPGAGATFHVFLPAVRRAAPVAAPAAAPSPIATGTGRILVMDDEEVVRASVGLTLKRLGFTVELAPDGDAAVTRYLKEREQGRPFSAVVLDLTVRGGMGGLEAMQKLRVVDPAVNAIVMSGYSENEALRDFARHGFRTALAKPFTAEELQRAIAVALGSPRTGQP